MDRSRKGKAFKLDTLCLKLQEKQTDAEGEEGNNSGMEDMEDELQIDEMDDYENMETNEDKQIKEGEPIYGNSKPLTDLERFEQMRKFAEAASPPHNFERNSSSPPNESISENETKEKVDPSEEQIDPKEFIEKMNNLSEDVPQAVRRGTELAWKIDHPRHHRGTSTHQQWDL